LLPAATGIRSFNSQNNAVFFNFDEDYQNTLNLVLLKSDFEAFGGEDKIDDLQAQLMNKNIRVKGEISL
jgi:bisphosphoglycerate-independent phosphoglycerate mutase (AlkP superfamily)